MDSDHSTVRALESALYDAVQMLDEAAERVERNNPALHTDPLADRIKHVARRGREAMRRARDR